MIDKRYLLTNAKPYGYEKNTPLNTNHHICSNYIHKININNDISSINNIMLNNIYNSDLFNVLTISTNNDLYRTLTSDSFIILKFLDNIDSVCTIEH